VTSSFAANPLAFNGNESSDATTLRITTTSATPIGTYHFIVVAKIGTTADTALTRGIVVVSTAAPLQLGFATAALSGATSTCIGPITVQTQSNTGAPLVPAANTDVTLSSSASTGSFFSDASCGTALPSNRVRVAANGQGAGSASLYYRDTQQGTPTITATAGGLTPASQQQTITAPVAQTTALAVAPATGTFGGTTTLSATLTAGTTGVAGKPVAFTLNNANVGTATTNASGVATLTNVSLAGINAGAYPTAMAASFAGDAGFTASNGSAALTVTAAPVAFAITNTPPRPSTGPPRPSRSRAPRPASPRR
jgi:hypothetical protein